MTAQKGLLDAIQTAKATGLQVVGARVQTEKSEGRTVITVELSFADPSAPEAKPTKWS